MGNERLSASSRIDASSEWMAGGSHRGEVSLPVVLFVVHFVIGAMRDGMVRPFADRIPCSTGYERRPAGSHGADDAGARRWKTYGEIDGICRAAGDGGTDSGSCACGRNSSTCLVALAVLDQPSGWGARDPFSDSVSSQRPRGYAASGSRSSGIRSALSGTRALSLWVGPSGCSLGFDRNGRGDRPACSFYPSLGQAGRSRLDRPAALQGQGLPSLGCNAVSLEWNYLLVPDVDSDLFDSGMRAFAEHGWMDDGSAGLGDGVLIPSDGHDDA